MMRRPHPVIRYLLLILLATVGWYLFVPALDMPVQGLQENALLSVLATMSLLILAVGYYAVYRPRMQVNLTDGCAAILLVVVTVSRFCYPGLASAVKYDEVMQATMLYVSLRIIFMAERRALTVLLMLLCSLGIYEAWIGISQIYGLAYSNHGFFKVTGTLFNPGPYAGFLAPVFICSVACIVGSRKLMERTLSSWASLRRLGPGVLIWGVTPYLLSWGAALMTTLVLPATMSRAAWVSVIGGCGILALQECGAMTRFRREWAANRLRVSFLSGMTFFLLVFSIAGVYYIKRPSAEGRLLMWKIDSRIMLHHPLCGVGLGNFAGAFGEEQADYFSSEKRPEGEIKIAGCPESGFNEFLQFGAEMGVGGFALLLVLTGTSVISQIRRNRPFGYGLLTAALFACFSYPWSVLPLRLLFVLLLAGTRSGMVVRIRKYGHLFLLLLLAGCFVCGFGIYGRYDRKVDARRQWGDVRVWLNSEAYDDLIEEGERLKEVLQDDFRFLYDYGYALHKTGNYAYSNELLKKGMQLCCDPMFWNIAGKNYEALGNFPAAEQAYLHAHNMIPDRIYPLYLLTKLQATTGKPKKAYATALRVVNYTPKVESVQTRQMQEELRKLIDSIYLN